LDFFFLETLLNEELFFFLLEGKHQFFVLKRLEGEKIVLRFKAFRRKKNQFFVLKRLEGKKISSSF
jgi:hypothetical protein